MLTALLCVNAVVWGLAGLAWAVEKLALASLRRRLLKAQIEQLEWEARAKSREWARR
jgi:hypothetical protein